MAVQAPTDSLPRHTEGDRTREKNLQGSRPVTKAKQNETSHGGDDPERCLLHGARERSLTSGFRQQAAQCHK